MALLAVADYPRGYWDPHPPLLPPWAAGWLIVALLVVAVVLAYTRD